MVLGCWATVDSVGLHVPSDAGGGAADGYGLHVTAALEPLPVALAEVPPEPAEEPDALAELEALTGALDGPDALAALEEPAG